MQLSKLVIEKLKTTTDLRLRVALALGIEEISVKRALERGSKTLNDFRAINVIKAETGLTEEEIFKTEKTNA